MQPTAISAKKVMSQVLEAQAQGGQYVEWIPWHSRVHTTGFANANGEVVAGSTLRFFAGVQGQVAQGFNRTLTEADTALRAGEAVMPGGQEVVLFDLGVYVNPEAPTWIKEAIAYYSVLRQKRHATTYEFGPTFAWGRADVGLQSSSAATTVANTTINQSVNGRVMGRTLRDGALIALPAKQPIEFALNVRSAFFSTDTGNSVALGGTPIDNTGQTVTGPLIDSFQREVCGIVGFMAWGYRFSLPG